MLNPSFCIFPGRQAGRCLEHCLMNPFHLPAIQFAQQPFLCSNIRLALTDAILHSQVDIEESRHVSERVLMVPSTWTN